MKLNIMTYMRIFKQMFEKKGFKQLIKIKVQDVNE